MPPPEDRTAPDPLMLGLRALAESARAGPVRLKTMPALWARMAEIGREALGAPRVTWWVLSDDELECRAVAGAAGELAVGHKVPRDRLAAHRARLEAAAIPRVHLDGLAPGAALEVPTWVGDALGGVLRVDHGPTPREWTDAELLFATTAAHTAGAHLQAEWRLRAELRAAGSEARYSQLVETLPVTVYAFDIRTGKLDYLSQNSTDLGGLDPAAFAAWGGVAAWVDNIDAADRPAVRRRFSEAVSADFAPDLTYRVRLPDGRRAYVRDRCALVRDAQGRPLAIHGMLNDVTREHEALLETREHARRFRELLDNAELAAVTLDLGGAVTFVNGTLAGIIGYTPSDLVGRSWFDTVVPSSERGTARAVLLGRLEVGVAPPRSEYSVRTAAGEPRRMLWTHVALRDLDGKITGVSSLGFDLTARDRAESRRHHADRLASLGHLAAGVAHDLNNLIHVLQLTAEELAGTSSAAAVLAREQQTALAQGKALVTSLLGFARGREPGRTRCAVDEQLRLTSPLLSRVAAASGLELETGAEGAVVACEPAQLQQILHNLVTNAAQASVGRPGPISVSTARLPLPAPLAGRADLPAGIDMVRLRVADRGAGIPEAVLARILEPYFTTKQERGTGLGLATANGIAQQAGGFIDVRSAAGVGSTFDVWLPVRGPSISRL